MERHNLITVICFNAFNKCITNTIFINSEIDFSFHTSSHTIFLVVRAPHTHTQQHNKENYRLQSKYENNLVAKVALFQFVNSFLSLFYIAFYLRDQEKLKEQLAGLLISRQIIGNLRESVFPYFMEQLKLAKMSFVMWGALSPTQEANHSFDSADSKVGQRQYS